MKSELRFQLLVAVAVLAMQPGRDRLRRFRRPRRARWQPPESFAVDRRHGAAFGGDVHRARQGADPSALHQLPSGRRPPAADDRQPAAPAAGHARRGRPWARRRCAVRSAIRTRISSPAACRAIRNGISRRARWRGRAKRSAKFARRSKIPARNGGRKARRTDPPHRRRHAGRLGLGARRRPQPAPGTQKQAGALVEAWVKSGAACPAK